MTFVAVSVFVLTRGVTVPAFCVEWHTSPTYTSARCRAPAATCSPEFLRKCGIAAASPQHPGFPSASCVSWRWPSHRRPVQLVRRVETLSGHLPIDRKHRFSEKRHTMSMVSSRFTIQALPPNDNFDFNFFK